MARRLQCNVDKGPSLRRKPLGLRSRVMLQEAPLSQSAPRSPSDVIRMGNKNEGGRSPLPFPSIICLSSLCTFWSSTNSHVEAMPVQTLTALVHGNKAGPRAL